MSLEPPLTYSKGAEKGPMRRHYHPYGHHYTSSPGDDGRWQSQQSRQSQQSQQSQYSQQPQGAQQPQGPQESRHPSHDNYHPHPYHDSRDRPTTSQHTEDATTRSHYSAPPLSRRDARSAFTSYSQIRQRDRQSHSPQMEPPVENSVAIRDRERTRNIKIESPPPYELPILESGETEAINSYHYPGYPHYQSYDYPSYYPPETTHVHNTNQHSGIEEGMGSFHNYPPVYCPYNYNYNYNPYAYSSAASPTAASMTQISQLPSYPGATPPDQSSTSKELKETPSVMTEGTTPSSVARRGGGLELSSSFAATSPLQRRNSSRSTPTPPLKNNTNLGNLKREDDSDDDYSRKETLKRPIPLHNQDFEPIPLEQALVTGPPTHILQPISSIQAPLSPPRSYSREKQRQKTQSRYVSASASTSPYPGKGAWEKRYQELIEYKNRHGHCDVPQSYPENPSLGIWVNKQRMERKNRENGTRSTMDESRYNRLVSIGFKWAKPKGQASWDEKYRELTAYKKKFGNCHVPTKYKDNTALGRWVSTQRHEYKKYMEGDLSSSMTPSRLSLLEKVGFAWNMACP